MWCLDALAVAGPWQGQGIGGLLLRAVADAAAAAGIGGLHGCCPPERAGFYRRHGFTVVRYPDAAAFDCADGTELELEPAEAFRLFLARCEHITRRPSRQARTVADRASA